MSEAAKSGQAAILSRLAPHPPRPPAEVHSRAGRNLPAAIATALLLLTIVGLTLAFEIKIFVGLVVIALTLGLWEAAGAFLAREIRIPLIPLLVGQLLMVIFTWTHGIGAGLIGFLVTSAAALLVRTWSRKPGALTDGTAGIFALSWVGLFGIFAVAMAGMPNGALVIVTFILLPVANDTGGWAAGVLFGKHPIAPSISPKKSWEGFIGSAIACILVAFLTVAWMLSLDWYWALLAGLLTPVFATTGDFAESLLKRDLGVKDMGSIFPGHGGMLDRIDSLLFCAPMLYVLFALGFGIL